MTSVLVGLLLPDEGAGDVAPEVAAVDSRDFSMALAAVALFPDSGNSGSALSLGAGGGVAGVGVPMLRTFALPAVSAFGVVSAPIESTLGFGASLPFTAVDAAAGAGALTGAPSVAGGLFITIGAWRG